jgi:hypothetical protein
MKYQVKIEGLTNDPVEFIVKDGVKWLGLIGAGGITLSKNTTRVKYDIKAAVYFNRYLLCHEATHILQARKLGWKYLPTYLWQAIKALFRKHNIPLEIEAYANEKKGKYSYTPI